MATLNKFDPSKTIYMRGFDGFGAAASICQASTTGFSAYGVFRDMADFAVFVLYDTDNAYEHFSMKYLPDQNLTGLVLNYDYTSTGCQAIDSPKYSWIDWSQLDALQWTGEPQQVRLWANATLAGGSAFSVASNTLEIVSAGATIYDRLTLFLNNLAFDFVASGGESAATIATWFANSVNSLNWAADAVTPTCVIASVASNVITFQNGRWGTVNATGTAVTWVSGEVFTGIAAGSHIYLGGVGYTVSSVTSPTSLVLTAGVPTALTGACYLAERGGDDGNMTTLYLLTRSGNVSLSANKATIPLTGGNSDGVVWSVSLPFTTLGIDQLRQAWLTIAPKLTNAAAYADTQWSATFSSWSVTDPGSIRALKVAGYGSVRVGNQSAWATYAGSGWTQQNANNYYLGFAQATNNPGDSVTIKYHSQYAHDLWLGTELYCDRGIVSISLDSGTPITLDPFINVASTASSILTRRKMFSSVAMGAHSVTITLTSSNHTALGSWDTNSIGHAFLFDYIEAVVYADPTASVGSYSNVTAALDYDTNQTYQLPPQRVLWGLTNLGFLGQINEYLGVFWWNQRVRSGGAWVTASVTIGGTWAAGDTAFINLGGFLFGKSVFAEDTDATIAQHFALYINQTAITVYASVSGSVITIYLRTPNWNEPTFSVSKTSTSGTIATSGALGYGTDGTWMIDDTQANPINYPVRQWHSDFYSAAHTAGLGVSTAVSMELVNPPDNPGGGKVYCARFGDGSQVLTSTGFSDLNSAQLAVGSSTVITFQASVFKELAALQAAASLPVYLQFGEFLWWFYSSISSGGDAPAPVVGYASWTAPISIGTVAAHGLTTGSRVIVSGVGGNTAANGTWTIIVTDSTHFTLTGSSGNGTYTSGGHVAGGTMAFYDTDTTAAATTALGRSLYTFTCQDDDPIVNSGADAAFLAARLGSHVSSIMSTVLASYSGASFELLYPNDVNFASCYYTQTLPYPQGGRLNRAVNFASSWVSPSASGFARLKMEALSWGSEYRNLTNAYASIIFPQSSGLTWPMADVGYLVPVFNGGCPWRSEYLDALNTGVSLIVFWAFDHICMMGWPLPLPTNQPTAVVL